MVMAVNLFIESFSVVVIKLCVFVPSNKLLYTSLD